MKIVDFDGTVLDATFSVPLPEDDRLSIVYEFSGGRRSFLCVLFGADNEALRVLTSLMTRVLPLARA